MSKDGGTFFWEINTGLSKKAKISYYNENGKGTINLKYPIKIKKGIALAFMESTSYDDLKAKTVIRRERKLPL
jgi:hypothetical protein